jgi:XapX domain-containing protein
MLMYLVSLAAGVLVGVVYSVLGVRSPAPPLVALVGLLGILVGEQLLPMGQRMLAGCDLPAAWRQSACAAHLFGTLPGRNAPGAADPPNVAAKKES